MLLIVAVAVAGSFTSAPIELQFRSALVTAAIVIALYVFVGNSGVLSFGHVSFVAVGAFAAGLTTLPEALKLSRQPGSLPVDRRTRRSATALSLVIAAVVGGVFAFLVGVPLMRLSGLAAGIATFAVLAITNNVLRNWEDRPGRADALARSRDDQLLAGDRSALIARALIAFVYQRSRYGRMLRASREDPPAAHRLRGQHPPPALAGFHALGRAGRVRGRAARPPARLHQHEQVYLDLTFITLAMLVIGGVGSLWGATVGALLVSGLDSLLTSSRTASATSTVPTGHAARHAGRADGADPALPAARASRAAASSRCRLPAGPAHGRRRRHAAPELRRRRA